MPEPLNRLFEAPVEFKAVLARPAEQRSRQELDAIVRWFYERPRREHLYGRARRAVRLATKAEDVEDAEAIVEDFFAERVYRMLSKTDVANIGALFLKEFDQFLSGRVKRLTRDTDLRDNLVGSSPPRHVGEPEGIEGVVEGPPRKRLRRIDRLLLGWWSSKPPDMERSEGSGEWVETTVFGPRKVPQGRHFLVQAFAHVPDQAAQARRLAVEFDEEAGRLGFKTLGAMVLPGTRLVFRLAVPGLEIVSPVQEIVWRGHTESVAFGVEVPSEHPVGNIIGTVTVAVDAVPIGRITFKVEVKAPARAKSAKLDALDAIPTAVRRYELAFVSYASKDRDMVLMMVRMLRIQRIRIFQDVISLEPGDRWARELFRRIDECDLFILFWSSHAKASEWVMKEVRYAIDRKGGDDDAPPDIYPMVLEGPPPLPPPPELQHLHFDDSFLYFIGRGHAGVQP